MERMPTEGLTPEIQQSVDTLLKTYTGEKLRVLDQLRVLVRHNGQELQLPLLVVAGNRQMEALEFVGTIRSPLIQFYRWTSTQFPEWRTCSLPWLVVRNSLN